MADRDAVHLMSSADESDGVAPSKGIPREGEAWCGAPRDKVVLFTFDPEKVTCSACRRASSARRGAYS